MRAGRIGIGNDECLIYPETLLENIVNQIGEHRPDLVVIDSIQTIYTDLLDSSAGSVSPVSYTHLDVYKRQHTGMAAQLFPQTPLQHAQRYGQQRRVAHAPLAGQHLRSIRFIRTAALYPCLLYTSVPSKSTAINALCIAILFLYFTCEFAEEKFDPLAVAYLLMVVAIAVSVTVSIPVTIAVSVPVAMAACACAVEHDAHVMELLLAVEPFDVGQLTAVEHAFAHDIDTEVGQTVRNHRIG